MHNPLKTLGFCVLLTGLAACNMQQANKSSAASPDLGEDEIIIPVEALQPARGDIAEFLETNTRIQAENRVELIAQGVGQCEAVLVEEGDFVKQGQILAELEKEEVKAALAQAEVQMRQSQSDFETTKRGYERGIFPEVEYTSKKFAYEQAVENVKQQEEQLKNQTIRAPITGLITQRNIQQGMLVNSGAPVFTIVDPTSYILAIRVVESELQQLKIGQKAKVEVDALGGETLNAEVRRINPNIDEIGTIKVVLDFEDGDLPRLREGMYVRVNLVVDTHENALLVPKDAIIEENSRQYVYVIREAKSGETLEPKEMTEGAGEDAKGAALAAEKDERTGPKLIAEKIEIETGLEDEDHVEVLRGLDDDAPIVTLGQYALRSGSEVTVTSAEALLAENADLTVDEAIEKKRRERESDDAAPPKE